MQELRTGDNIQNEVFKDFDFSVIHFFRPSDSNSVAVKELFDGAKQEFEQGIDQGSISPRKVGWYSIDMDDFEDELPFDKEQVKSEQLVLGKLGQHKYLSYSRQQGTEPENVSQVVSMIQELTGDFITHLECENI